jgi:hypothetical protein
MSATADDSIRSKSAIVWWHVYAHLLLGEGVYAHLLLGEGVHVHLLLGEGMQVPFLRLMLSVCAPAHPLTRSPSADKTTSVTPAGKKSRWGTYL